MDYRELLKKYISHVDTYESCTFITPEYIENMGFTADEVAELQKLDAEVSLEQGNKFGDNL